MPPTKFEFDRFLDTHLGAGANFLLNLQHHGVVTGDVGPEEVRQFTEKQQMAPQRLYVNPVGVDGSQGRVWAYFNLHEQRRKTIEFHGIDIDGTTIRRKYAPAQVLQGRPVTDPFVHAVEGKTLWTLAYYYFLKLGIIRLHDVHDQDKLVGDFKDLAVILGYIEVSSDEENDSDSDNDTTITVNPRKSLIVRLPLSIANPKVQALFRLPEQVTEPVDLDDNEPKGAADDDAASPVSQPTSPGSSVVYVITRDTTAHTHISEQTSEQPPRFQLPTKFDDLFTTEERIKAYPDKIKAKKRRYEELQEEIDAMTMEADSIEAEINTLGKHEDADKKLKKRLMENMTIDEIYEAGQARSDWMKHRRSSV